MFEDDWRDVFAATTAHALFTNALENGVPMTSGLMKRFAVSAYEMAEALITQREVVLMKVMAEAAATSSSPTHVVRDEFVANDK